MIPVVSYAGRTVVVYGLARSGLTAVEALVAGGATAWVWDDRAEARAAAQGLGGIAIEPGAIVWADVAALVLSPGVPLTHPTPHPIVVAAQGAGVPIIGDVALMMQSIPRDQGIKVLGITGTNGKSTTTALLGHILKTAGLPTHVGGNIGLGVLGLPPATPGAHYVLELSSYQLDLMHDDRLDAAVLLNITPDHLDRHGGMAGYVAAKRRIFAHQGIGDVAVVGVDDAYGAEICTALMAHKGPEVVPISSRRMLSRGISVIEGAMYDSRSGRAELVVDVTAAPALLGRHNWQNAAAAYAAARGMGLRPDVIANALVNFPGLAHRMENLPTVGGVLFINDSKATNADAARQALSALDRVFWIAGGRAKAGGIEDLRDLFPRIQHAFLIGEAAEDFAQTLGSAVPHTLCGTMTAAVRAAFEAAKASGQDNPVVLLSPACASFDQYPDFEARGEDFRRLTAEVKTVMA
jgi:UDP-N-acetylmuramoylalanine--D-glutamate ligase